jgi:hypothetical protein
MTGQTTYSYVVGVVPTTTKNAIGLEPNIVDSSLPWQQHSLLETRMAGAAK